MSLMSVEEGFRWLKMCFYIKDNCIQECSFSDRDFGRKSDSIG